MRKITIFHVICLCLCFLTHMQLQSMGQDFEDDLVQPEQRDVPLLRGAIPPPPPPIGQSQQEGLAQLFAGVSIGVSTGLHCEHQPLELVSELESQELQRAEIVQHLRELERHAGIDALTKHAFIAKVVNFLLNHMGCVQELAPGDIKQQAFLNEPRHIDLSLWVERILSILKMPRVVVILALMNLKVVLVRYPTLVMSTINVRRLFFASCMVASKALEDIVYSNEGWAMISGCYTLQQVGRMELDLLDLLHWQAFPCFIRPLSESNGYFLAECQLSEREVVKTIDGLRCRVIEECYKGERRASVLSDEVFPYKTIESFIEEFLSEYDRLVPCRFRDVKETVPDRLSLE